MAQHAVEVILTRQLASYLATPIFIVDSDGNLAFYNEPAEAILGTRFEETGEMPVGQWSTVFEPRYEDGAPMPPGEVPLVIALEQRRPSTKRFRIRGLDGAHRSIVVMAFPLTGHGNGHLGAVALFWEAHDPAAPKDLL